METVTVTGSRDSGIVVGYGFGGYTGAGTTDTAAFYDWIRAGGDALPEVTVEASRETTPPVFGLPSETSQTSPGAPSAALPAPEADSSGDALETVLVVGEALASAAARFSPLSLITSFLFPAAPAERYGEIGRNPTRRGRAPRRTTRSTRRGRTPVARKPPPITDVPVLKRIGEALARLGNNTFRSLTRGITSQIGGERSSSARTGAVGLSRNPAISAFEGLETVTVTGRRPNLSPQVAVAPLLDPFSLSALGLSTAAAPRLAPALNPLARPAGRVTRAPVRQMLSPLYPGVAAPNPTSRTPLATQPTPSPSLIPNQIQLQQFNPEAVARQAVDKCPAAKKKDDKEKKKRKPRTQCRRGTYTQTAKGIIYRPKETIPCR